MISWSKSMKTPDLRHKLEQPDECIEWLGKELTKIGGKKTKAYKCWQEMLMYIAYCGKRMEKDNDNIVRLKEVVQQQHEDNKNRKGKGRDNEK
jgi:hypothetical protein|tara:strand:+ start:4 stop:282 length:279 start_codon:yes stop_codon:yes gene_type:complete